MEESKNDDGIFKKPLPIINQTTIDNFILQQPPGCADDTDSDDDEINSIINNSKIFESVERGRRSRSSSVSSVCSISSVIDDYIPEQWILKDFHLPPDIQMKKLGEVLNIIETVVTIGNSEPSNQVVNLESKVFNEDRLCIGVIYDVMGSVSDPIYCLRFESEIHAHSVSPGQVLYVAQSVKEYTETIFKETFKSMTVEDDTFCDDELDDDIDKAIEADFNMTTKDLKNEIEDNSTTFDPKVEAANYFGL
uniref:H/ACA ribonucleoprotein complex subunit n=1 Tax=Parastrongyloides trichosuri TaxID=131310 RepID=A0A0N5A4Y9_PARTI